MGMTTAQLDKETPPRTWGRRIAACHGPPEEGNTPTHVGKTGARRCARQEDGKHPHARGEDCGKIWIWKLLIETPPRTWGRHDWGHLAFCYPRNTPTHVGKTAAHSLKRNANVETPPRTWGRRSLPPAGGSGLGNTPTHVGKTREQDKGRRPGEKHPHARGEDPVPCRGPPHAGETPPRTWGRHDWGHLAFCYPRNTPTHVGKTTSVWLTAPRSGKHPHARGEDAPWGLRRSVSAETPPRTWGRRLDGITFTIYRGNTPTHVGKTRGDVSQNRESRKHPHARGEDRYGRRFPPPEEETPPRTWGRPVPLRRRGGQDRNTPTHVGKTETSRHGGRGSEKHPHARGEDGFRGNGRCPG